MDDAIGGRAGGRRLEALLAEARTRLIETGTRNRLVHVNRAAKRPSTLAIFVADTDALFSRLVREGRPYRFAPDPVLAARAAAGEPEPDGEQEKAQEGGGAFRTPMTFVTAELDASDEASARLDTLQTRLGPAPLEKRLLRFFRDARLLEEEQGVNILYLAIGFLRWYEEERSETLREAPLLLVPVSLVRDARRSTYELRAREEDIGLNLPLSERLRELGVSLPPIPEAEEWVASDYFDAVEEAIAAKPRWSVDRRGVELGLFSFAKLLMFHDLEPDSWPDRAILSHPLLQGLLVDGFPEALPPTESRPGDLDRRYAPADLLHVVDADHSQTLAIEAARREGNLVVQGPPGTGKSQTIANILAAAAHDGLTVLFVAEKMVALEVVHARLERAGLGPLCLELHSRAANKRLVAQELGKTLDGSVSAPDVSRSEKRLREVRDALNAASHDLHAPIGETGTTPHRVLGDLARAAGLGLPPPALAVETLATLSGEAYEAMLARAAILADLVARHGRADDHPWRGTTRLSLQPLDLDRLVPSCAALAEALPQRIEAAGTYAAALGAGAPRTLGETTGLARALEALAQAPGDPDMRDGIVALPEAALARCDALLAEAGEVISAIEADIALFAPAALEARTADVRAALARGAGSFFARLGGAYRRSVAELSTWIVGEMPREPGKRLALVDRLIALRQRLATLDEIGREARDVVGPLWAGRRTDVASLRALVAWRRGPAKILGADLARSWPRLRGFAGDERLARASREIDALVRDSLAELTTIVETLGLDLGRAFGAARLEAIPAARLAERLGAWRDGTSRFSEWRSMADAETALAAAGAGDLARRLADGRLAPEHAAEELRHARAEALWRRALAERPGLAALEGLRRGDLVREFVRLEHARRGEVSALIRARHAAAMPRGGQGEMGVIRGEVGKRRGHMALRRLIARAGSALQRIKPIFLMSPLSVAQYLPHGRIAFDLVVIDEASQVRPEDALGVLARGARVVVVGDAKQLPPTSFFDRLMADAGTADGEEEDDAEEPAGALAGAAKATELESILTLCEARGLPRTRLRWHYRSRHPSLIAVSNELFYQNDLVLPPSPEAALGEEGLVAIRVAGAYDRGGTRTNAIEARAVVEAAARHAAERPERSLGIVTFSTAQRDLVSLLLDEARRTDPALDAYIAEREGEEALFVKNLENVQGDERDVILISVGYGPRRAGEPLDSMAFGPVSSEGGERRLNVLFTRARLRCEVFVSFDSGDIDLGRARGRGPDALKRFLAFAETGVLDAASATGLDPESGFEEDVARAVGAMGYVADPQVGHAGFRIDLAVRHPARPGRWMLAVECDGAAYHGALWARERDRLRQEILEGMGWRFHRIWGTDWYYRREAELARLRAALESAEAERAPMLKPVLEIDGVIQEEAFAPPPAIGEPYRVASPRAPAGREPHEATHAQALRVLREIVAVEGPIHAEELTRRYASAFGASRAGQRIVDAVARTLALQGGGEDALVESDGFWMTRDQARAPVLRDRSQAPAGLKAAGMIAPVEIAAALARALADNGAMSRDEIVVASARLLGFQRTGADLRARIGEIVEREVAAGRVVAEGGGVRLA
ncbi:DUF3320 domain-containing protein [Salinarimonas ramus]|uniref:AAA domain-containing protein n=1 Tax=Salinarimonas ramus TaxID=690164 RepID=A0A917Q4U4_9HYPH|nr:DUF3320 domain-containing protein [Salinarimonas ramus]GGK22763.1 hypothetical protein GCM10011322_06840 [Salinarimonas ramus]